MKRWPLAPIHHLVYISSDAVYTDDANPVREDSPRAPTTTHGMMHAARELMLAASTAAPVVHLRPTLIYGAADPHNGYGPNRFRRQTKKANRFKSLAKEKSNGTMFWLMMSLESRPWPRPIKVKGRLNVVTGVSTSFKDIAEIVAKQFKGTVVSQPRPGPRPHLVHRFFDVTNTCKAFPTFQFTPLQQGLDLAKQGES